MATPRPTRLQWVLLAGAAVCYVIGYPLALVGHSNLGWVFVTVGGPLLVALGVVTVRRVHLGVAPQPSRPDKRPGL